MEGLSSPTHLLFVLLTVGLIILVVSWVRRLGRGVARTYAGHWEYQTVKVDDIPNGIGTSNKLDSLGKDGWEVVSVSLNAAGGDFIALMKRKAD